MPQPVEWLESKQDKNRNKMSFIGEWHECQQFGGRRHTSAMIRDLSPNSLFLLMAYVGSL